MRQTYNRGENRRKGTKLDIDLDNPAPLLEAERRRWRQPGLAAAVVTRDAVLYAGGVGARRVGGDGAVDGDTLFAAASLSKSFAAATAAMLADAGRLDLDDPVKAHLPEFELSNPWVSAEIRLRDLLCNRAGVESSEGRHRRSASSRADIVRRMKRQRFRHPFRAEFGYCSDTFTCIGAVVDRVAGVPWEQYAADAIWRPLGMNRTNADHLAARADANSATPHLMTADGPCAVDWAYEDQATPAGGVNSSVKDLAVWLQLHLGRGAFAGRRIVSARMMDEILTPHTPERGAFMDDEFAGVMGADIEDPAYALGWYCHWYQGARVFYHTGAIDGFRAVLGFLPDRDFGAVVLANADNAYLPRALFQTLVDRRLGLAAADWSGRFLEHEERRRARGAAEEADARREGGDAPAPFPPALLCGAYEDDTGFGAASVHLEDGALVLEAGAASFDLVHVGGRVFAAYRRAPYARIRQFLATVEGEGESGPTGWRTSQGAYFERVGAG